MKSIKLIMGLFACSVLFLAQSVAFAGDKCDDLANNAEWTAGFESLESNMKSGDYPMAVIEAEKLADICESSPDLAYTTATLYERMGDATKARYYYRKAAANSGRFDTPIEKQEKMWEKHIFAEHPESDPDNVFKLKVENKALKQDLESLRSAALMDEPQDDTPFYKAGLWTGIGIGGTGLLSMIIGSALVAGDANPIEYQNDGQNVVITKKYQAGRIMLGMGIGFTVAGAVMAGFFGYKLATIKDVQASIDFSINHAELTLTF